MSDSDAVDSLAPSPPRMRQNRRPNTDLA